MKNRVEVVVGVIIDKGRILLTQRAPNVEFPYAWESPGGKVNQGESHLAALQRELNEELGESTVIAGTKLTFREDFDAPTTARDSTIFGYKSYLLGTPKPLVALDLRWFGPDDLIGLPMTPANERNRERLIALLGEQQ